MIAPAKPHDQRTVPDWHDRFLRMLPTIKRYARAAFRDLDSEAREEMVEECIANCFCAYARLVERGKEHDAFATRLADYAIRQIRDGRRVGKKQNVRDVYDIHARVKGGYQLKYIGTPHDQCGGWRAQLVENGRTSPADLAAFKLDFFDAWLPSLPERDRHIAEDLGRGERTGDVAREYRVSASRISQLRRQLQESWLEFTADPVVLTPADGAAA
jgi:hypothetical protein